MSLRLKEIEEKKGNILSKILRVDPKSLKKAKVAKRSQSNISEIETRVIANIQEKINNPLFNLTIADYELMCSNKMMTKVINHKEHVYKECPEGKVRNPKTGRCIKSENLMKVINHKEHVYKECPEGKVRNPKTGRCIKSERI